MWIKAHGGSLYNLNNFSCVRTSGKSVLILDDQSETYVAGVFDDIRQAEKVMDEIFKHLHLGRNVFEVPGGDVN